MSSLYDAETPRHWARLASESVRIARSQPIGSLVTMLVVAGVCGAILSTTGRTVQAEAEVLARIDEAGSRSVVLSDTRGDAGIRPDAIDRIEALSGVEWAVGFGPAQDAAAAAVPGGTPVATRTLYGSLPDEVVTSGWSGQAGTALVGPEARRTLGMTHPVGGARRGDTDLAIVGWMHADEPLDFLNAGVLVAPDPDDRRARVGSLHVLVSEPRYVAPLTRAVLLLADPSDPDAVRVESSPAISEVRAAVRGELGQFGRRLVALILGTGLVLVAVNVYGATTARQRGVGRRRALGASRTDIVVLVTAQTVAVGALGTLIGTLVASSLVWHWTGALPSTSFALSIATLAVLTSAAAALPPATIAAHRDPVRVLRVP
jgi:putative ABC transport system permease protein